MVNKNSDVTLVLTSCGRLDLLKITLDSFVKYNNYPIKRLILTEDSGDERVLDIIPEALKDCALIIINNPQLGQIKSIDLAYSHVDTEYILHCEDDWEFFRPDFIQESKAILNSDEKILHIRMRKHNYKDSANLKLVDRKVINGCAYYSNAGKYKGLSWNPGLRRLSDYNLLGSFESLQAKQDTFIDVESAASQFYSDRGFEVVFLENYVVEHIGDAHHVLMPGEKMKKLKKRNKKIAKILLLIGLGYSLNLLQG
jgi:hypothetical protein